MDAPEIRYCMTSDGVQIAYATDSEGEGVPVLHLGVPFTDVRLSFWEEFASERLPMRGKRPSAWFDFRGCGRSDRNVDDVSMDAIECDLVAVIDRLAWPRFSLVAGGMSGPLAMKYAAEHPDQVHSLVLIQTYARAAAMGRISRMRALGSLLREDWESYLALMVWTMYGWTSEGDRLMRMLAGCTTHETALAYAAATASFDASEFVGNIEARTLIVGRSDMPVPSEEMFRQLGARIADARVVLVGRGPDDERRVAEAFLAEDDVGGTLGVRSRSGPVGTRTVLFTDIVGHTEMMRRLGDARGRDVLREYEQITRETLRSYDGSEVKTMGDGFMAWFASVTKAMDCAIALQRAFVTHEGERLHVRVGLNAGEPIEEDGDLFGSTVIMASRIAAHAGAGEILIPEPLRHLLSGKTYVYADRGETTLKGFEDAVRLYEVRWRM